MTWVVPDIVPADERFQGGEREMLQGFLQNARESLLHTIREYSGHCGQADIIRERIDGRTHS